MERLTEKCWRNLDPWECCGQDKYCQRGCHDEGGCTNGCKVPKMYCKLAKYEDAEEQGLLLRLPVPIGSTVYVIESECEGDPYDCYHGCEHCACLNTFVAEVKFDAEWFDCIGKTVFLTREEAEAALAEKGGVE